MIKGKKILLGVSGGIAAYKCTFLVRLLIKEGAEVRVVMTHSALDFVTSQSLSVLSKNEVVTDFFNQNLTWNNHVRLAEWADLYLIAPLTANTLAKMANGMCDNLLLATYFSSKCPVFVAPAMDLEMYRHITVQSNLQTLTERKVKVIPAETGELASGLQGEGRMAEPENILHFLKQYLNETLPLYSKTALINAGPTFEALDDVRFIGNRSSGKMGFAIAEALANAGAEVTLVLGPTYFEINNKQIKILRVESAEQMFETMLDQFSDKDIVICSAAVADYKPKIRVKGKIKKQADTLNLELIKTKDILAELGTLKKHQFLVGFALETEDLLQNATTKLTSKNLDLIVANQIDNSNSAFNSDFNRVTFVEKHNKITNIGFKPKEEIAKELVSTIVSRLTKNEAN